MLEHRKFESRLMEVVAPYDVDIKTTVVSLGAEVCKVSHRSLAQDRVSDFKVWVSKKTGISPSEQIQRDASRCERCCADYRSVASSPFQELSVKLRAPGTPVQAPSSKIHV
jgi:hypothetical protein